MNLLRTFLLVSAVSLSCGVVVAHGQTPQDSPDENPTISQAARSAGNELSKSITELNAMRAQIAGEKLPLAQELTTLEESVIQLRRDNEKVQRLVDAGALEIGTMKAEMKVRQDELSYIGSLLDEYARTFETKVGVGEMQIYGEPVETAKQAVENKTLTPTERFARQTLFTA